MLYMPPCPLIYQNHVAGSECSSELLPVVDNNLMHVFHPSMASNLVLVGYGSNGTRSCGWQESR